MRGWGHNMSRKKVQEKLTKRQRESQKIAREKAKKKFMRTTWRRCMFGAGGLVFTYGIFAGWGYVDSGKFTLAVQEKKDAFYGLTADAGFAVDEIFLEGRKSTPIAAVNKAVGLERGDPILSVSVEELRERLMALKQVRYVEIERTLPGTLHIHLLEREPVALWQNDGRYTLVDVDGVQMESCKEVCPKLPIIVGEDAPSATPELLTMLAKEPELYHQVVSATRMGERRWNIKFANGIEVKLPEATPEEAWAELARMNREEQVLSRDIRVIDMRVQDRIFIKTAPTPVENLPQAGAKNT